MRRAEVREQPVLKYTRWVWLKDGWRWTQRQLQTFHMLSRTQLKTARAWRLKNAMRDSTPRPRRARSPRPTQALLQLGAALPLHLFKRLALTLKAHWAGILNAFDSRLNNGDVEPSTALSTPPRPVPASIAPPPT